MSYELRIFFSFPVFPLEEWQEIINLIQAIEHPSNEFEWFCPADDSTVWIGVSAQDPNDLKRGAPIGTKWLVSVHTTLGRSEKAVWTQNERYLGI